MSPKTRAKAIKAIEHRGALLVYPVKNKDEPASIWSELYPRRKMVWEWDAGADHRVATLWSLREDLSSSSEVVYAKWFQNRATFFSLETAINLLAYLKSHAFSETRLSPTSREALEVLMNDSPLSTKQLKSALNLEGRLLEPAYNRALKPLWQRLLIVGFGEFQDSSFPSLGIGSTATLFEELWQISHAVEFARAEEFLRAKLGAENPFFKFARKLVTPSL